MGQLKLVATVVAAREGDEQQRDAMAAVCECGPHYSNDRFHVFQIAGQNHFHLQCSRCGTSYCPQQECQ
jgi:hypothetical protein